MNTAQFIAIQQAAQLDEQEAEQLVRQIVMRRQSRIAALYEYIDRQIIPIDEAFVRAIGVDTGARAVVMGAAVHRHIVKRRGANTPDAELAAARLEEALTDLRYRRATHREPSVRDVIGFVASANRHLLVALKFVAPPSGVDEVWIRTAHPVGLKTLRKQRAANEFVAIGSAEPAVAGGHGPRLLSEPRR